MRPILPLLVMLALTFPTSAAECCEGWCDEIARVGTPEAAAQFHVAVNNGCMRCHPEFPTVWIYQESNGVSGLQRGDELVDETCGGQIAPDTLIF